MAIKFNKFKKKEAIKFLLREQYYSEWEVIDGLNQHPEGINFYEWLYKKGIISQKENQRIQDELYLEKHTEK
jgi:hypothetical protein